MHKFILIACTLFVCTNALSFAGDPSGKKLYRTCAACHGVNGGGLLSRNAPRLAGIEPWYLKRQLLNFKNGIRGTKPQDAYGSQMAVFAHTLQFKTDIPLLLSYIRGLSPARSKVTIKGNVKHGMKIYLLCAPCHGQSGNGSKEHDAPRLRDIQDWYLVRQLRNFRNGTRGYGDRDTYGRQMAVVAVKLKNKQSILDVVAYINSFGTTAN